MASFPSQHTLTEKYVGAGEQRRLLPASPKSLHANQTLGFPCHLPLLRLPPSTSRYTQGKSLVEHSTEDLTLETIMSEPREDVSLKLSAKPPEHGPLHETHNSSQGTAMDPCSRESWDEGCCPPSMPLLGAKHGTLKHSQLWMWGFSQLNPQQQNKGHCPQTAR